MVAETSPPLRLRVAAAGRLVRDEPFIVAELDVRLDVAVQSSRTTAKS